MPHPLSIRRVCLLALLLLLWLPGAGPATANPGRTVADWRALGEAQLGQGRLISALTLFGEIAAQHPGYAPAWDGLRRSLDRLGRPARSEAILRYALSRDPGHQRAYLAAWQELDRAHPLRFSASASLLPSDNVQHVASQRFLVTDIGTFVIKDGGQETPGVGVGYGASLDWYLHPRPGHRFRLRASYGGAWFDIPSLRYNEYTLALRYEHLGGRLPWSVEAFTSQRRYEAGPQESTPDNIARGLGFSGLWQPRDGTVVLWQLGGLYRDYSKRAYLNGPEYNAALEVRTRLGARGRLSYGLDLGRGLPRSSYNRYTSVGLHVGYERRLFRGFRAGITLGVEDRRYDTLFPVLGLRRHDQTLSIGLSAQLTRVKIFGQVPKLGCSYRKTDSNVALYSFNSVDCAMALKLGF